jgi:hypothetical protein
MGQHIDQFREKLRIKRTTVDGNIAALKANIGSNARSAEIVGALLLAPVFGLAGCANGQFSNADTYTYTQNNLRNVTSENAKQQGLSAASQVCAQNQRTLLPLENGRRSTDAYSVTFRCLTPGEAERPEMAQNRESQNPPQPAQ